MSGLDIVGVDDLWAGRGDPAAALRARSNDAALVLVHNPDAADQQAWPGFRGWMLAGHTHGGQCKAPFLPPPLLPVQNKRYVAGAVSVGRAVALHQVHGALAWALVAWLGVHLAGIARKSWESRENLVRAMVDGRKRHDGPPVRARAGAAAVLVVGVAAVGIGAVATARTSVGPTLVQDERWVEACGECHLAFHPAVLPAASWDEMLAAEDHFGEFLGLDPETQAALSAYARANAAELGQSELGVRLVAEGFTGDRVTDSATWRAAHRELDPSVFEREEVGGQVRCAACHPDAEQGTFDGRAADVPEPGTVRIGREP
ncbi:MAG: hypothetical protein ABMA64_24120 [Myxococcota bacterium]